jgi:SAM-dependent methyltransferase
VKKAEYRRMFEAEQAQWWYVGQRAIADALIEPPLAELDTGGRAPCILDAGCGTGGNLLQLRRLGRATGVDLAPDAARRWRDRGVQASRASLLALPFPDGLFDLVTSFDVIYHEWVPDDAAAIEEMVRVLRPGGLLLIRVPALEILRGAHDAAVGTRRRYTRPELVGLLESAGLTTMRSTYANFFLFPLLLARRTLDRALRREGSDVAFLPAPVEWVFRRLLLLEAGLIRRGLSLPFGASVTALARRSERSGPAQRRATSA